MFETHVIFQDLSAVLLVGLEPIDRRCGPDSSMVPKGTRFFGRGMEVWTIPNVLPSGYLLHSYGEWPNL